MYLKKYLSEGLIQVALLLSLCGVMVDVGLEPHLPPSWHQMILGQTSALTQTRFHNLRNRLEDGHGSHSKNLDLDGFFTTRRLLGWVRSLDRLQVPRAEVETWLVQREPDPRPDRLVLLERGAAQPHREASGPAAPSRPGLAHLEEEEGEEEAGQQQEVTHLHHQVFHHTLDDNGEEEEDEDMMGMERPHSEAESAPSLQECLRLLEETFPLSEEQQVGGRMEELGCPVLSPTAEPSSLAVELNWQDLFDLMEPETSDVDMTSPYESGPCGTLADNLLIREAHGDVGLQHDLLWSTHRPQPQLLPLTPSAELDAQSSTFNLEAFSEVNGPPDHMDLLSDDSTGDFSMGPNVDTATFGMDLLARGPAENLEEEEHALYPGNLSFGSSSPSLDPLISPPSVFLEDEEEDQEEEDGVDEDLPSQLSHLLEEEMRLLDLTLEEGFSPEMAARLQEEGYLHHEDGDGPQPTTAVDPTEPSPLDGADEADSDSGLSLDFSYSPSASPCASEASCYSSSSSSTSSSSSSSSSCMSEGDERQCEVEDEDVGRRFSGVTIKQEEEEEEEMGAVGGEYPEDLKMFLPVTHGHHKMLNGAPWLEHVGHDHTYNQPLVPAAPPSPPTKASHHKAKRFYFSSESKLWGRDERRARGLKIPFSNHLIVNLPVEEFNELLSQHQLSEEQLNLVRDIRRRGKNKIAAQNCRKRKMDVLLELDDDVTLLRRRRARLLREKQEALRSLQEMKRRLGTLYQEVFSRLRDEEGRPLDSAEFFLQFEDGGDVAVTSRRQEGWTPLTEERTNKKQRNKRK